MHNKTHLFKFYVTLFIKKFYCIIFQKFEFLNDRFKQLLFKLYQVNYTFDIFIYFFDFPKKVWRIRSRSFMLFSWTKSFSMVSKSSSLAITLIIVFNNWKLFKKKALIVLSKILPLYNFCRNKLFYTCSLRLLIVLHFVLI